MANHLAELMTRVDKAKNRSERDAASALAVDTILHIWGHRADSDRINPLSDLQPILRVLRTLSQEESPWVFLPGNPRRDAGRRVYRLVRRLTICLSAIELEKVEKLQKGLVRAARTAKYQSPGERVLLAHLTPWLELFPADKTKNRSKLQKGKRRVKPGTKHPDLIALASQLTEEATAALRELSAALRGNLNTPGR